MPIRTATDFFDAMQEEIESLKAGTLDVEVAREVSKFRGHQVKVAAIASQNMRFSLKTRKGDTVTLLPETAESSGEPKTTSAAA